MRDPKEEWNRLRAENRQLRDQFGNGVRPAIPQSSWAYAGYDDPESACQSLFWASASGDPKLALDSLCPEARASWAQCSEEEVAAFVSRLQKMAQHSASFQILGQRKISDDEVELITDNHPDRPDIENCRWTFKRVGSEFDARDQTLYVDIGGDPAWYCIEVGVRGFALSMSKVHDVVIRGLEMRNNRQPGGQWPLVSVSDCERVTMDQCRIFRGDFCGLGMGSSKQCLVRGCDLSDNGCVGLGMGQTEDCTVEDCTLLRNNYRRFSGDWGVAAGMKNIPGNKRTTIRRCECAYTIEGEGIWFDTDNSDIRILDNVCHDNDDCGIFFEINKGGGVIAGNLVFGNHGRGIYVSGSQSTWVVHNTVVENLAGIVAMTRAKDEPPRNTRVLNNLLIRNYVTGESLTRGCDLTLEMTPDPAWRRDMGSVADYNVYACNAWAPTMRHNWNDNHTLSEWQQRYDQDRHSIQAEVLYERFGTAFRLLGEKGLDVAGPLPGPVAAVWKPVNPKRVGANRTSWP